MSKLKNLPQVIFASKDPKEIEKKLLDAWQAGGGSLLYPADPRRLFTKTHADGSARISANQDYAAKMNLLAYAEGVFLDHLGALLQVWRIDPLPSTTTVRFVLSAAQPRNVMIPQGTRVTKSGATFYFAVAGDYSVPAGHTSIDVTVEAMEAGEAGNGYLPNELDQLVDPLPWIASIANLETTIGGSDQEDDESLRERIQLAPESFSTAGPEGAYIYWTKTAQTGIIDVAAWSPEPGVVEVDFLLTGGELPNEAVIERVAEVLNDRTRRPLTDHVRIQAPEVVPFDVEVTWWMYASDEIQRVQIQAAVQKAFDEWILWQKSKIGRDLNPSELIRLIQAAGAKRVEILSPKYTVIERNQVAVASGNQTLYFGGEEDA